MAEAIGFAILAAATTTAEATALGSGIASIVGGAALLTAPCGFKAPERTANERRERVRLRRRGGGDDGRLGGRG